MTIEILENHVYKRELTDEEQEEAKVQYEKNNEQKAKDLIEEMNKHFEQQVIIVGDEEESKGVSSSKKGGSKGAEPDKDAELICSTCGIKFETKQEFREHYKSDLHVENVKRKCKGEPVLTEEEFQRQKEEEFDREMFGMKKKGGAKDKRRKKGKGRGDDDD